MKFAKLLRKGVVLVCLAWLPLTPLTAMSVEVPKTKELKEQCEKALTNLATYKSSEFGFSIKYPQNWEKAEGQPPLICRFLTDNGLVSYRVSAEKLSVPMTVEEYAKNVNQELEKQYPVKGSPLTRVEESACKIGSLDAHKSIYILKLDAEGSSAKMLQYLVVANQIAYAFNYTAIEGAYDAFMPLIEEAVKSLEFQPVTAGGADKSKSNHSTESK